MASLLDLTKNLFSRDKPKKANPIIQFMDRDKSMPGFQAVPGGWEGAKARVKSQYQKEKQYTGASLREGVNLPIEADWGAIFPKAFEKLSKVNIPLSAGLPFLKALPADKQPKIPVGRILTGSLSTPQEIRDIKTKLQRQQPLTEPERKLAKNYFQNYAAGLTLDVAGLKSMGKVTSNADEVAEGLFSKDIQRYKSAKARVGVLDSKVDPTEALKIESSIRDNVNKIQKDFLDGKITIDQRKVLADKEFSRSSNQAKGTIEPLLQEARKYKSADEFKNFMRGSATQYGDYNPSLRAKYGVTDEATRISDLGVKPDLDVTIYRGVPDTAKNNIVDGDFITTDRLSAESYAGRDSVVFKKVKAKDLIADYPSEFDKNNPFTIGSEFIYSDSKNKLTPLTDSQLTNIYNQAKGTIRRIGLDL